VNDRSAWQRIDLDEGQAFEGMTVGGQRTLERLAHRPGCCGASPDAWLKYNGHVGP
jgi:hypothetical protein